MPNLNGEIFNKWNCFMFFFFWIGCCLFNLFHTSFTAWVLVRRTLPNLVQCYSFSRLNVVHWLSLAFTSYVDRLGFDASWSLVQSLVVIFKVEKAEVFFSLFWYPNCCIVFFSNGRISLRRIKQFVEIWWWPYSFTDTSDLHRILRSLILEAQTDHVISSCKVLLRKKSIEGFVVIYVHSNITIIHDIIWKTALLNFF